MLLLLRRTGTRRVMLASRARRSVVVVLLAALVGCTDGPTVDQQARQQAERAEEAAARTAEELSRMGTRIGRLERELRRDFRRELRREALRLRVVFGRLRASTASLKATLKDVRSEADASSQRSISATKRSRALLRDLTRLARAVAVLTQRFNFHLRHSRRR